MLHPRVRKDYQRIQDPLNLKEGNGKGIPKEEPVFLLRAQDRLFIPILEQYITLAELAGYDPRIVQGLKAHVQETKLYQITHPPKNADI